MFQKISTSCNFVQNKINYAVTFAFCMLTALGGSVFAAGEQPQVQLSVPDVGWDSIAANLMSSLTPAIVAGIGVALSVWVVYACVRFFRRAAS